MKVWAVNGVLTNQTNIVVAKNDFNLHIWRLPYLDNAAVKIAVPG